MNGTLRNAPALVYPLKAALTRSRSLAWLVTRRPRADGAGIRILFYHRVSRERDELAVTPHSFRRQMELLAADGYRVVDVGEVVRLLASGEPAPRTIGLSFDDGYRDVAEEGLPVLAEHGFRATVFVPPSVIDGRASFSWYRSPPPLLGWDEIVELERAGTLRFEAHSLTHPNLLALDDEAAWSEIADSKRVLEQRLGRPVELFSYPGGLFGERERRLVARAGFRAAVSCEPGVNVPATDLLALRRRQIDARDSLLDFRAKVSGAHDSPPPLRALYRSARYGSGTRSPYSPSARE